MNERRKAARIEEEDGNFRGREGIAWRRILTIPDVPTSHGRKLGFLSSMGFSSFFLPYMYGL